MSVSINVGFEGQRNCCITLVVPGILVGSIVNEVSGYVIEEMMIVKF